MKLFLSLFSTVFSKMAKSLLFLRDKIWVKSYLFYVVFVCDFDETILVLDRYYFQTSVIITRSTGMMWYEIDAKVTFCKFLKKIATFSSFICLLTLNVYKMKFQVLYFTFICYQLILIIEFVSQMKYLCFDLMLPSKINQVILVAILFSLD